MMRAIKALVTALLLAPVATRLSAQTFGPAGPEVAVDPDPHFTYSPKIAAHSDGSFAVAWARVQGNGLTDTHVLSRAGGPNGTLDRLVELDHTPDYAVIDGVAPLTGRYAVTWSKDFRVTSGLPCFEDPEHCRSATLTRKLALNGRPTMPRVAFRRVATARPVGGFIETWETLRGELNVVLVDDAEHPIAPVTTIDAGYVIWNAVVPGPEGNFVVLWTSQTSVHAPAYGVKAQSFNSHGSSDSDPFVVVPPNANGSFADAAVGGDGTLVVASSSESDSAGPIMLSTFDQIGHRTAGPVRVTSGEFTEAAFSVALDAAGRVLLVWGEWTPQLDRVATLARVFTLQGAPLGRAVDITSPSSTSAYPVVGVPVAAAAGNGSWWVAWNSGSMPGPLGVSKTWQIFVRRFTLAAAPSG